MPLKKAWEQLINNEELRGQINQHLERIEKLIQVGTGVDSRNKEPDDTSGSSESPE